MRKTRCDSILDKLGSKHREQLRLWLTEEKLSYSAIRVRIFEEWGLEVSDSQLSRYWQRLSPEWCMQRLRESKKMVDQLGEELSKTAPQLEAAALATLKQITFELLSNRNPNLKEVRGLISVLVSNRRLDLEESKMQHQLRVYEENNATVRANLEKTKSKGGLSEETISEIEEALRLL